MVNSEVLSLNYGIGRYISENSRHGFWGTGALAQISSQLQKEMPGLKGYSETSLKDMRTFYEEWAPLVNRQPVANELASASNQMLGQLSFYLSALDRQVRKPHENPPIGIVLCREFNRMVVEVAISDYTKPMGVATFQLGKNAPEDLTRVLPPADELSKCIENTDEPQD